MVSLRLMSEFEDTNLSAWRTVIALDHLDIADLLIVEPEDRVQSIFYELEQIVGIRFRDVLILAGKSCFALPSRPAFRHSEEEPQLETEWTREWFGWPEANRSSSEHLLGLDGLRWRASDSATSRKPRTTFRHRSARHGEFDHRRRLRSFDFAELQRRSQRRSRSSTPAVWIASFDRLEKNSEG